MVGSAGVESMDKRKTIASIRDENMGISEKADFITIKATVIYIKHGKSGKPANRMISFLGSNDVMRM